MGGILGIDPSSYDREMLVGKDSRGDREKEEDSVGTSTKVKFMKATDREEIGDNNGTG